MRSCPFRCRCARQGEVVMRQRNTANSLSLPNVPSWTITSACSILSLQGPFPLGGHCRLQPRLDKSGGVALQFQAAAFLFLHGIKVSWPHGAHATHDLVYRLITPAHNPIFLPRQSAGRQRYSHPDAGSAQKDTSRTATDRASSSQTKRRRPRI
jgi:hypothetical protein